MLKSDAPEEVRWYRNDAHCVWIMEDNESFDKPVNWDSIVEECVKSVDAITHNSVVFDSLNLHR